MGRDGFRGEKVDGPRWGPLGTAACGAGAASWFLGGLTASGVGVLAAVLGFLGARRKQRLSQAGLMLGAAATLFVCLQDLGIARRPEALTSDRTHLVRSILATIEAHEILGNAPLDPEEQAQLIAVLEKGLQEARLVRVERIDREVPGFAEHYREGLIQGTERLIRGVRDGDTGTSLDGGVRLEHWGRWNRKHREALGRLPESNPSLAATIAAWW